MFWRTPDAPVNDGSCTNGYEACSQVTFSQPVTAVCVAPVKDVSKRYELTPARLKPFWLSFLLFCTFLYPVTLMAQSLQYHYSEILFSAILCSKVKGAYDSVFV